MNDRHKLAHAALAVAHFATSIILLIDNYIAHAICALAAAAAYAVLYHGSHGHHHDDPDPGPAKPVEPPSGDDPAQS